MSYTPGPWNLFAPKNPDGPWFVGWNDDRGGRIVASGLSSADARLIAAAPELLEALDNAHGILQVNLGDVDPHVRAACDLMWTAITKARGGS